jgi:endonuclease YncB( thermonuclease family)
MSKIILFLICISAYAQEFTAKTIRILDGDTAKISLKPGQVHSLRLMGIDAPEEHLVVEIPSGGTTSAGQHPWGGLSTYALIKLLPLDANITVKSIGRDRYGRHVGTAYLNGADINLEMIKTGWALPYIICDGQECEMYDIGKYLSACHEARVLEKGIFNRENPLNEFPFVFRLRMQNRKPDKFVGDFFTKKLFSPSEYSKVDICNAVFFYSKEEAHRMGYHE